LIKVKIDDNVAINSAANAQSTGVPVNLLWENGVVNVQPASVLFNEAVLLIKGKNEFKSSADSGKFEQSPLLSPFRTSIKVFNSI
jgi:hypothetical protein